MPKKEATALVKKASAQLPVKVGGILGALSTETSTGFENVRPQDTAIPFIGILQSLSPQVKRGHAQQIDGAAEGMLFNNVTREVSDPPLTVIPCAFQKAYVEWIPREAGGGFVQQHKDETILASCRKDERNNNVLPNGNHIVQTAYHFVLIDRGSGIYERAVVSMSKTQLKKSRRWLSQMMNLKIKLPNGKVIQPPMFSHSYELGVELEQKDTNSWYGFIFGAPVLLTSAEAYAEAKQFYGEVIAGSIQVKPPEDEHADTAGHPSEETAI